MTETLSRAIGRRRVALVIAALVAGAVIVAVEARRTAAVRGAVSACSALVAAANRGDLGTVRALCSREFLEQGGPSLAAEGGLVGLPRSIDRNFRAWRDGPDVLICPSGRVGPVYRFVRERGAWRYDGPAGVLGPG